MKFDMRKTLPTLREIGFQLWDPLGLAGMSKESELTTGELRCLDEAAEIRSEFCSPFRDNRSC